MFCDRCGAKLVTGAQSCPSCGKSFAPFMPPKRGIEGHVRLLGILCLAHAAFQAGPGLLLLTIFGSRFLPPEVPQFMRVFLPFIGGLLVAAGALSVLVGIGLLMRLGWARIAALIAGAIGLINIPFGTALGIYTMWVLLPADHEQKYRALTRVA